MKEYEVRVDAILTEPATEDQVDTLVDELGSFFPVVSGSWGEKALETVLTVKASGVHHALSIGLTVYGTAMYKAGLVLPDGSIDAIKIKTSTGESQ